jgi:hypothetical protein
LALAVPLSRFTPRVGGGSAFYVRHIMASRTSNPDELRRRVDEVLYYVWDPIGVADEPFARAEYDSYVPKVLELLTSQDDPTPIATYLDGVVSERMGLSSNLSHCKQVAELLQRHKRAIHEGCA